MKYNCKIANGHFLVEIADKLYLLDTGSPYTFCFDNSLRTISIDGISYQLELYTFYEYYKKEVVDELTKENVFGFIGTSVLSKTSFTICHEENGFYTIEFNAKPNLCENPIDVTINKNFINGNLVIEGRNTIVLFETGASVNYIMNISNNTLKPSTRTHDLDGPGYSIDCDSYKIDFQIAGLTKEGYFSIPNQQDSSYKVMNYYHYDAICGLFLSQSGKPIFDEYVVFDFNKNKIFIK